MFDHYPRNLGFFFTFVCSGHILLRSFPPICSAIVCEMGSRLQFMVLVDAECIILGQPAMKGSDGAGGVFAPMGLETEFPFPDCIVRIASVI